MRRRLLVAVIGALLLSACSRDTEVADQASTPSPEATEAPPCSVEGGGQATVEDDRTASEHALLTDVRFDTDGCPRVVLEFENAVPPHRIAYEVGPFSECGSGEEVDTSGWGATAYIVFHSNSASGVDLSVAPFRQTYEGKKDIAVSSPVLRRLRETCDFEATMEWIIALDERHDFTVDTLDDPPRLVIDISES